MSDTTPTIESQIADLRLLIRGSSKALAALNDIEDAITLIRQRYADKECQRLTAVVRVLTGGDERRYYAAVAEAQKLHPELWQNVYVKAQDASLP